MFICQVVQELAGSITCEEVGSAAFLINLCSSLRQL